MPGFCGCLSFLPFFFYHDSLSVTSSGGLLFLCADLLLPNSVALTEFIGWSWEDFPVCDNLAQKVWTGEFKYMPIPTGTVYLPNQQGIENACPERSDPTHLSIGGGCCPRTGPCPSARLLSQSCSICSYKFHTLFPQNHSSLSPPLSILNILQMFHIDSNLNLKNLKIK